jgi:hypothetical protein
VQITVVPNDNEFWHDAHRGRASRDYTDLEAAWALREAIEKKAGPGTKNNIVLAIDAQHAGVLATGGVINTYLAEFGDPVAKFGFSSVWIVGPTVTYCARLGAGRP